MIQEHFHDFNSSSDKGKKTGKFVMKANHLDRHVMLAQLKVSERGKTRMRVLF